MSEAVSALDALALRSSVRDALGDISPMWRVRELMATAQGWDRVEWARLCEQVGVAGIAVDPAVGGAGLSWREAALVFEEAGRSLLCAPLLSVAGLAIPLLTAMGDRGATEEFLPRVVSGRWIPAVATATVDGRYDVDHSGVTVDSGRLRGRCGYVVDGGGADAFLVPARTTGGIGVFLVDSTAPGVSVTPLVTLDQTRKQAHVDLDLDVADARRIGTGDAGAVVRRAFAISQTMLAAEQVGVMAQCLDLTVEFVKTRIQFGRPIGSFQAVKQRLAEVLVTLESARSAASAAARAAAEDSDDLGWTASLAKAYCSEAASAIAGETIQLHGGIGFTWEHDAHLYFKRARASEQMLGTPQEHYDLVAAHVAAL